MDLKMLQDYKEWLKRSPEDIINAVKGLNTGKEISGWAVVFNSSVFPKGIPVWAHRVRNFLNREPRFLSRLHNNEGSIFLNAVYKVKPRQENTTEKVLRIFALTNHVYKDESNTVWFQMSPGGAIYHFREVGNATFAAGVQEWMGQGGTPIFKLIAPDGTGGSSETIVKNELRVSRTVSAMLPKASRGAVIGDLNVPMPVHHIIQDDLEYQGSYNYADTVDLGNAFHEKFDVQPHKDKGRYKTYVNPDGRDGRHVPLKFRQFPDIVKGESIPLAEQI